MEAPSLGFRKGKTFSSSAQQLHVFHYWSLSLFFNKQIVLYYLLGTNRTNKQFQVIAEQTLLFPITFSPDLD